MPQNKPGFVIALALLAQAVLGCASMQRQDERKAQLDSLLGASKEEIVWALGPPESRDSEGATEVWQWREDQGTVSRGSSSSKSQDHSDAGGFWGGFVNGLSGGSSTQSTSSVKTFECFEATAIYFRDDTAVRWVRKGRNRYGRSYGDEGVLSTVARSDVAAGSTHSRTDRGVTLRSE